MEKTYKTYNFKYFPNCTISAIWDNKNVIKVTNDANPRHPILEINCVHTIVGKVEEKKGLSLKDVDIEYFSSEYVKKLTLAPNEHFLALCSFVEYLAENLADKSQISEFQDTLSNSLLSQILKFCESKSKPLSILTLEEELLNEETRAETLAAMDLDWLIVALKFNNPEIDNLIKTQFYYNYYYEAEENEEESQDVVKFVSAWLSMRGRPLIIDNRVIYMNKKDTRLSLNIYDILNSSVCRSSYTELIIEKKKNIMKEPSHFILKYGEKKAEFVVFPSAHGREYSVLFFKVLWEGIWYTPYDFYYQKRVNSEIYKISHQNSLEIVNKFIKELVFAHFFGLWRGASLSSY